MVSVPRTARLNAATVRQRTHGHATMKLITGISIRGFRSIREGDLEHLGALTALVGKNSSGKSNALRALNLFFNNEVEPGEPLILARDVHYRPKARRKKLIDIAVHFSLPANFRFRKSLATLKSALGTDFTIRRTWGLDARKALSISTELSHSGVVKSNGSALADQFLQLVSFRYIPNRTVPAALLREESRGIASSIFTKMHGTAGDALLSSVRTAADTLLKRAAESMTKSGAPVKAPSIASPESLADLLTVSGFQATGLLGNVVRDVQWGAGTQAFFLYEVLQAMDTNYSRGFGWKQAAIWGVEEPESGLHRDLETRLAEEFRTWTNDGQLKLQVLHTTHSPVFTMASDAGFWVEIPSGVTEWKRTEIPRLVRDAERRGVSGWVQPVLAFPTNPVVLVEGTIDADVLTHAAGLLGSTAIRFLALPDLDPAEKTGGKDAIATYLKRHGGLLGNRPEECPLLVVLDWEVPVTELENTRKAYGPNGAFAVMRMDPKHADADVGPDFKGIERFYPGKIIRDGNAADEYSVAVSPTKPMSISAAQLDAAKGPLRRRILATQNSSDIKALSGVIGDIEAAIKTLVARQSVLPLAP